MTVQVLLSTYNGAAHLPALMDSVLAQDHPNLEMLVRDDGSRDTTISLLDAYAASHSNVSIIRGDNLGFARSFLELLERSSPAAEYVAFCDQDDVWLRDKVSHAIECLSKHPPDIPALYCSRRAVVNEDLRPIGHSRLPTRGLSFRNALVECPVPGCTTLLNRAAHRLLVGQWPQEVCSHDWWAYLVISAFGRIIYDETPRILYRQHMSNVVGLSQGRLDLLRAQVRRFRKFGRLQLVTRQAEAFRRVYGAALPDEPRDTLARFLNSRTRFLNRLRYAWSCDVYRQSAGNDFILKGLITFNRL